MSGMFMSSASHFKHSLQRLLILLLLLVSLSPVLHSQESIALSWPLTSPDRVYIANSAAQTGFAAGGAAGRVVFDRTYGATTGGWNTSELNPDAFYEYRVIPPEGSHLELDRLSLDLSLGGGGMNAAVYYSTDGFRNHRQELGQPVFFYTTDPQPLSFNTAITVSHPDTLLVRVYAWGAEGLNTEFNNRNVRMEGLAFGDRPLSETTAIIEKGPLIKLPLPGGQEPFLAPLADSMYTTPGLHTWTCPADVTCIKVECWGGGGRGGNRTSSGEGGGGGGGTS